MTRKVLAQSELQVTSINFCGHLPGCSLELPDREIAPTQSELSQLPTFEHQMIWEFELLLADSAHFSSPTLLLLDSIGSHITSTIGGEVKPSKSSFGQKGQRPFSFKKQTKKAREVLGCRTLVQEVNLHNLLACSTERLVWFSCSFDWLHDAT